MSFFGDALGFEKFQLSDWWRKAKKNPEQLLLGAADPWGAKLWGKVLGKDYEPFVDQMGGPYGGSTISAFGKNDGGVYGRAEAAGVDTKSAKGIHDAAHVLSALFAGGYGASALGGGGGAAAGTAGGTGGGLLSSAAPTAASFMPGTAGAAGLEGVTVVGSAGGGAAMTPGTAAAMSSAAASAAPTVQQSFDWQNLLRQSQGLMGNQQQQSQQPVVMQPPQQANNNALRQSMAKQARMQQLRRKINRTPQENYELGMLNRSGLLG